MLVRRESKGVPSVTGAFRCREGRRDHKQLRIFTVYCCTPLSMRESWRESESGQHTSRAACVCGTRETSTNLSRIFAFTRFRTTVCHTHTLSAASSECTLMSHYTYYWSQRACRVRRVRVAYRTRFGNVWRPLPSCNYASKTESDMKKPSMHLTCSLSEQRLAKESKVEIPPEQASQARDGNWQPTSIQGLEFPFSRARRRNQ